MSDISSEPPLRLSLGDDRAVLIPSDLFARDTTPSNAAGRHDDITAYHHNTYHAEHHEPVSGEKVDTAFLDNPVFISPQKVDDLKRFRMLFVGTLLLIVSSTQGLHSVFGVLLMQKLYLYSAKDMMTVYMWGCIVGMFVFPFGFMYDWLGPRPVIIVCTLLAAAGHTLFALMFRGDIEHTVHNSSCFYGLMCWGCYGLQVAVLPSMLTHMPRDRGQPTALLQTFSGLGASFFACIFRGFFNNHFDHLMWLMVAITLFFGAIGTWYVHDAPYITNRWQQLSLTPQAQLQKLLIRNRYASQLVPKRRFAIVTMILVALNFYLTIQTVTVAYLADDMTKAKYRGIACGAIVLTLCCSILAFPFDVIDGVTIQDKAVLRSAQEKSEKLMQSRELGEESHHPLHSSHHHDDNENNNGDNGEEEKKTDTSGSGEHESGSQQQHLHGEEETVIASETRYALISPNRHLIEATPTALGEDANIMTTTAAVVGNNVLDTHVTATPQLLSRENSAALLGFSNHASVVEAIHVCGEVYVAPVYQTTFLQSLTYMDLWLMMHTTMVMWGIGLVITGNWNIQVMSASRFTALDYKTYILFSAVSGVCTASGRVFISIYEVILRVLRERYGLVCASTIGYPIASVGLFLSLIVWIVLPDNKSLVVAYIIMPYFYGMNSSMTIYVLGTIFDRDLGMHYGFCFLGASIGVILFYYLAWFLPFDDASTNIPFLGRMCLKHRRCMSTTVGIYIAAVFTAILSSYIVHRRYARLVAGQLKHRRVLRRALRRILGRA